MSTTIEGNGVTIDGSGQREILFVRPDSPNAAAPINVTIKDVAMVNGLARGGNGGTGGYGGGGGMGAGGAIFVGAGVALTAENVDLTGNKAAGGNGGDRTDQPSGSGAGGLNGGAGQGVTPTSSGGGGGTGAGANATSTTGGGTAGGTAGAAGGAYSGGGGAARTAPAIGGAGGWGGGGGGAYFRTDDLTTPRGGAGGFGGGGGGGASDGRGGYYSPGGRGGFGGGAGGGQGRPGTPTVIAPPAVPGFGGGMTSAYAGGGGGGGGLGGAIFVEDGGTFTLSGNGTVGGGAATGGTGGVGSDGSVAGTGLGLGGGFFLNGKIALNLQNAAGETIETADTIASDAYTDPAHTNADPAGDGIDGGVVKSGAGTVNLRGTNTYAGGTTVNGGVVNATSNVNLGHASGAVRLNGGALQWGADFDTARNVQLGVAGGTLDTNGFNTTANGTISGPGQLIKEGAGVLTMRNPSNNSYAGGTAINGGTLSAATNEALGAASGSLSFDGGTLFAAGTFNINRATTVNAGGGTFEVKNGSTLWQEGATGGGGHLTKSGAGSMVLLNDATHTGGTTIATGALHLGGGGTVGSLSGDIVNDGFLFFNRSDTLSVAGQISGTGGVGQNGAGTTIMTGNNTYTGGTSIIYGTLQIGAGGTSGSIVGDITNYASLAFNRSDVLTYGGVVSGGGAVTQAGSGSTIFTANQTYSGGTTITAGTLQLGNGGAAGSILGDVANAGTLVFNRSNALSYDGVVSGTGSVNQIGAGTTTFTANQTYTGGTTITAGTLQVGMAARPAPLPAMSPTTRAWPSIAPML